MTEVHAVADCKERFTLILLATLDINIIRKINTIMLEMYSLCGAYAALNM